MKCRMHVIIDKKIYIKHHFACFQVAEHDGPKASYFFKIFGNEIHYDDFHGLDLEQLKDKMNFLDWLLKLSQEQQLDYTKSMMFLDSELVVPTAVGLPLRLAVDGTATVNVKMDGKMDVRQMFSNPSTVDINGSIKPRYVPLFYIGSFHGRKRLPKSSTPKTRFCNAKYEIVI